MRPLGHYVLCWTYILITFAVDKGTLCVCLTVFPCLLQAAEERALVNQSVIGSLTKKETATLQTAYDELNKQLEGKVGHSGGTRTVSDSSDFGTAAGAVGFGARHLPLDAAETHSRFQAKVQTSFAQVVSTQSNINRSPPLPAPASSVGSQNGREQVNGKRPRPQLFVNTNVDAGMYVGHGPQGSEGAAPAAAAVAAARSAALAASRISHTSSVHQGCPPGMGSSAAAAASAAAEAAARYASGMGTNPSIPSIHHQRAQHPQQQPVQHQPVGVVGRGGGGRGGEYPITIPGTSVRRYMHMQLLLALMSAPGLKVVAPAKVSWDRLGYYPVDAVFGPPEPGGHPTCTPRLTPSATQIGSSGSPRFTDSVAPTPPKRARSVRDAGGVSVHDTIAAGGPTTTGAMAMPPSQHSPRTSAMLSGLPVGSEGAVMFDEAGELSPTSFMGMGGVGPMSPYQFPSTGLEGSILGGGGGGGGGSDGSGSGGDHSQHFDFTAAMGGIGGGSQGLPPSYNFSDFAPIYSPNPVSPTFGAGRLSPLAGALSPRSLSPRVNWASGFPAFSG